MRRAGIDHAVRPAITARLLFAHWPL